MNIGQKLLVAFVIAVGIMIFAALSGLGLGLFALVAHLLLLPSWVDSWMILLGLIILWHILPIHWKSWNKPYVIEGHAMIQASRRTVWDRVLPQPGRAYHAEAFDAVTAVPGTPNRLDLHVEDHASALALPPLQVVLEAVEPDCYLRMSYLNLEAFPLWSKDLVQSEYILEDTPDGVRLTLRETLCRLQLSTVVSLFVLNPCRDSAVKIKALCEGKPDTSWMTWLGQQNAQAQNDQLGLRAFGGVALLVCVFLTLLTSALVFGLAAWVSIP